MSSAAIKRELAKRAKAAKEAAETPKFSIEAFCFDKQVQFIRDPARFKTAVCSRRSGKTVSCAADLHDTTERFEGDVAYITVNRTSAKRIIWRDLVKINSDYKLGGKLDNTDLTITKPNGNIIYVTGAKDASDAEKLRGQKFRKVYVDECQSFRAYIQDLVEDIVEPALTDYNGSLILIGTPGPVPAGYFYDASHNPAWSHHRWTMVDNPHILRQSGRNPIDIIRELAERRGLSTSSPGILREYFGQWVKDVDSLVFTFNPLVNVTGSAPSLPDMTYIFGIDIGWKDSDAIAVLGYHAKSKNVYLVEELVTAKQDITSLVGQIKRLEAKYKPVRMVMDAGALGKKIQEEIRHRHGLHIEAAEKQRKHEFIKLLNDDLRTGKLLARPNSRFEEDCSLLQWDWTDPAKPVVDDRYHSDICDAVLYGWRECKHYFYEPEPAKAPRNMDAYMQELEQREAEALEQRLAGTDQAQFTDVNDWTDLDISDDGIDWD